MIGWMRKFFKPKPLFPDKCSWDCFNEAEVSCCGMVLCGVCFIGHGMENHFYNDPENLVYAEPNSKPRPSAGKGE